MSAGCGRPARDVPRRRLPDRHVPRHGRRRSGCSRRRAERRRLLDRDRGAEPAAEAEARHDGEREHRDRAAQQRAPRVPTAAAALPPDRGDVRRRSTSRCRRRSRAAVAVDGGRRGAAAWTGGGQGGAQAGAGSRVRQGRSRGRLRRCGWQQPAARRPQRRQTPATSARRCSGRPRRPRTPQRQ